MEFIRFIFASPLHYFGFLFLAYVICSLINTIVYNIAVTLKRDYTNINYTYNFPNVKEFNNETEDKLTHNKFKEIDEDYDKEERVEKWLFHRI